jgi:hypothetical protein
MKSPSECYVVHFISETWILYHGSETKVNAHIENIFSIHNIFTGYMQIAIIICGLCVLCG